MGAAAERERARIRALTTTGGFLLAEDGLPIRSTNRLAALVVAYIYHRRTYTLSHINGFFPATLTGNLHTEAAETLWRVLPNLLEEDIAYLRGYADSLPAEPPSQSDTTHQVARDASAIWDYLRVHPEADALITRFTFVPEPRGSYGWRR